ncbi:amino acid transporter [Tenacibaculum discolor]|uniref:APC family permease n=2 Tax=Tenacibaculum TaxID=104267 RepID=A0A2G1BWL9_9FLAO|nr:MULTISPECIES: APC family permease [Tenacibaculum]MDE1206864.1 APC family permease [Tenacibaculum larymnensis]MDP2540459.1 APC family permease [Tenacibaculum discolor]PHN98420.1 amino acid transporter [Tenacibaculum discolor]PHN99462.1 amino acid transporter [Rhodobacteraceae bacterium 4F10]
MSKKIGLKEAISIGIGGMVGGGIFAVLGLAVLLAKGGTPIAFLLAGILALLTSYSYVNLSKKYPDRGGTVKFINQGFGRTIFSGAINNLLWVSYIVMLSLYASAFGSYAPNLWEITQNKTINFHIYASAIIIIATAINYYSIAVVGKIESYAVVIKLIILIGFIAIGAYGLIGNPNMAQLSISNWENPIKLFAGGMVIFVAYEGFELIANAAPDILNPEKNISKAYYYSVIFVIVLYIIIALVTVGSLPFNQIAKAQDYVLAEAAKPMLGQVGFTIITIAALISTFSAINASLYGGSKVNYEIAEDDELPHHFLAKFWNQPIGLLITAIATLVLVNTLNLESISTAGSVGFILIFGIVNYVGFKLSKETGANKIIPLLGCFLCVIALVILIKQQLQSNLIGVFVSLGIITLCFIIEWIYKKNETKAI